MAKGSQLTQLKSAISQAGLAKQQQAGKKRKRAQNEEKDREKRAAKLQEIQQKFNPFDVKVTKLKHDVGGRKLTGITGKPAQSKQAGIEQRKKTLLKEVEEKGRAGGIVDRRFGENDATMTPEERMLERFTRERQRASKGVAFNLEDEDELTHYGQSLSKLDDFDNVGLNLDDDEEDRGQIDSETVKRAHFGGFDDDEGNDDEPARKKSKAEVMAEVIAKSKEHKIQRQMDRGKDDNLRHQLDQELDSIRSLLFAPDPLSASLEKPSTAPFSDAKKDNDQEYDQFVRELVFEKRAKPKDRTKTEEELALEEKEALEKAERRRARRMRGEGDVDSDEEGPGLGKRKRGVRSADDLEDDFHEEGEDWGGIGAGLEKDDASSGEEEDDEDGGEEVGSDQADEDESEDDSEDGDSDGVDEEGRSEGQPDDLVPSKKRRHVPSTKMELPFTFACPSSHEELLDIIEEIEEKDVPTVVQRVRTLYHPSLAPDNKFKLQALTGVLIDHILYIASPPTPQYSLLSSLLPHLFSLTKTYPIQSAEHFLSKLSLMHKNLRRGLSRGATDPDARTWPGLSELALLRVIGMVWPTSDMNHHVISPTRLLMGSYLGLCRIRSLQDLASGLFLSTLFMQYEELSKRLVPEALNLTINAVLHIAPHGFKTSASLPGSFPSPDFGSERCRPLALDVKKAKKLSVGPPDLSKMFGEERRDEQTKVDLLGLSIDLLGRFAEMYKGLEAFIELYDPILSVLESIETDKLAEGLQTRLSCVVDALRRLLKFSRQARRPLHLQAHKPIPIPSYIPKFESSSSSYLRAQDPDHERNEAAKLRKQYKQERKGAIRELRKDARFLAGVEQEKQREKDRAYHMRMKHVFGSIEGERAEQKALEREKAREKRRAGRNIASSLVVMSLPSSTPFPIPTFQNNVGDSTTPGALLDFLRTLISENLSGQNVPQNQEHKDTWVTVISGLSDHLLSSFPSSREGTWNVLHEKIILVDTTLTIIHQVLTKIDGLWTGAAGIAEKALFRLINTCGVLDTRNDADVQEGGSVLSPRQLRERTFSVTVELMRYLGNADNAARGDEKRTWEILRTTILECIQTGEELLSDATIRTLPMSVCLSRTPRIKLGLEQRDSSLEVQTDKHSCISLENPSNIADVLCLLLDLVIGALSPPVPSHSFLVDMIPRAAGLFRSTFNAFSHGRWPLPPAKRAQCMLHIISLANKLRPVCDFTSFENVFGDMVSRLLLCRLTEVTDDCQDLIDSTLTKVFKSPISVPFMKPTVQAILTSLSSHGSLDSSNLVGITSSIPQFRRSNPHFCYQVLAAAYLSHVLVHLDVGTLRQIKTSFSTDELPETTLAFVQSVDKQILSRESAIADAMDVDSQADQAPSYQDRVRMIAQNIISLDGFDSKSELSDYKFGKQMLEYLRIQLTGRMDGFSSEQKVSIANALIQLPCLLLHPKSEVCARAPKRTMSLLPAYLDMTMALLSDAGGPIPSAVRKAAYKTIACAMSHQAKDRADVNMDGMADVLCRGMADQDRGIRLGAGRAVIELVRLYHAIGKSTWVKVERIFDTFYRLLETAKDPAKETVLITVGGVGNIRATDTNILGVAISCLIAQLGRSSPILRGVSYMQLLALAKTHQKTTYGLLLPYLDEVAPFLVSRWHSQPVLLLECCRFIAIAPHDFMIFTLPRTLPQLFGNCEQKVLEKISKDLSRKPSSLFLDNSSDILTSVFLLQGPGQTNSALTFIVNLLTQAADDATIDTVSVVRSCLVPLLAKLVNVLGSADTVKSQRARSALSKVQKCLPPANENRATERQDLGEFLKTHMLGILSNMNDMLQDIQGKTSVEAKQQILRSLGALVSTIGSSITSIMATLRMKLVVPELSDTVLDSWYIFMTTLSPSDVGPHVGPTSASLVSSWQIFSSDGREVARRSLHFLLFDLGDQLGSSLDEFVDPFSIEDLADVHAELKRLRSNWTEERKLKQVLERVANDNITVAIEALRELKVLMNHHQEFFQNLATGDNFDHAVGWVLRTLFAASCCDSDGAEPLRLLAFECIGALGAVDPDRFDFGASDSRIVVMKNFRDQEESVHFVLHLIVDVLIGAFRSANDINYQNHLAYAIQELLKFCQFTSDLVAPRSSKPISLTIRKRWNNLPKHVLETVTPLLEARFHVSDRPLPPWVLPIYPTQTTYREWIQLWTTYLIIHAYGDTAQSIFRVFRAAIRNKDVGVAHHLLPHLVLNALVSGDEAGTENIRTELLAVLEDQVNPHSASTPDKKLLKKRRQYLCSWTISTNGSDWFAGISRHLKKSEVRTTRTSQNTNEAEEQLLRVDSVLSSIDQDLMANAAFQCKAYARSLMSFERRIVSLRERQAHTVEIQDCYERLHEIYANIDEPDGMEGVSTLILSPTLEHQIRQHESTGRWTSAQSCWELQLQQSPDKLEHHIGLLRCLRNLGHYDTLRTHVKGVLTRNPEWKSSLAGFQVESAWMIGDWGEVKALVDETNAQTSSMVMARLLLAYRSEDASAIVQAQSQAFMVLGSAITASGAREYRHAYDAVLNLHLVHEVDMVHEFVKSLPLSGPGSSRQRQNILGTLSRNLVARLELTLPTFRIREPVLSMRRTAFGLSARRYRPLAGEIGRAWLTSAKIARKAGHWQTAYSAMLQARQSHTPFSFIQSAKLVKAAGEPLRALQELDNSIRASALGEEAPGDVIDLTGDDEESKQMKAKAQLLRARWMNESDRFEIPDNMKAYEDALTLWPKWESVTFYYGKFQDDCYKDLSVSDQRSRGIRMNLATVRAFTKAMKYGSKFIYQTMPRLLTIWLDLGEDRSLSRGDIFKKINAEVSRAITVVPAYKWYTAFPQIVSRVGIENAEVYNVLAKLILMVLQEFPLQAIWLFLAVIKSTKPIREGRGRQILDRLKNLPSNTSRATVLPRLVNECMAMANELLAMCDHHFKDDGKSYSMKKEFPRLAKLVPCNLIIPLQESLIATLPPTSSTVDSHYQPFPADPPTFHRFQDEVEVMRSLAKPRKIAILSQHGQIFQFLGKPKDDLRKDARLMDFDAIINKLLKANSESRRRKLHIRTYGVITLNEECGFIQWVPDTIPVRPVLMKSYDARSIRSWTPELIAVFQRIKESTDKEAAKIFVKEVLPQCPPVLHEWFIETFPEPSAWLASRLMYSRTAAVMSIVGWILGLGDRHCENILLDTNNGAVVHVDFNCLFEKGKTLETPERVPFRLTQNIVDGLGVAGVEGLFRIACENVMQLLRDNKDTLMSVLDAFIHDPLVEWEDEKRRMEREAIRRNGNSVKSSVDLRMLAKNSLLPIEKKLKGIYSTSKERPEKEISTSNLVQMLIQEAMDDANLGKMYPGWAPWH
ncbi:hypothetical protein EW146_g4222 [Bondarzewia mesenterica]|uniref:non-specific serine/threonine protein kinase n=1 Tax=Bondarzewia mesenterica TaxID=1095465 RepID=A0A4S4LXD1_9AGAM|nr:hypothetical protein EW146_g4222 [Bondarzewia mesenterica]